MKEAYQLRDRIPLLQSSTRLEKIHKGYSGDDKYIVYDSDERALYILRAFSIDQKHNKRLEFRCLNWMEQQGVKCSRPIEIGVLPDQGLGYMIVSFIEGNEAAEELPLLTAEEQFNIGIEAGLQLRKIHQLRCPENMTPWYERMAAKHHRYRIEYAKCGTMIKGEKRLLAFIDEHLHIMQDRPNLFQHDDFHVGNLIVNNGKLSGVIDFDRFDWGDPIHEFVKVGMFSSEVSVPFSVGQIFGYHDRKEPGEYFWQLYSLYLAMTLISSIVWILKVKPEELELMLAKIYRVMEDHENFSRITPAWYSQSEAYPIF
ncbi:aminoglycoside phosphotransferase family protein [Paenibacillus sp. P96]|uniref:Aminoglycoside phosphotransferase family protein n=1 Tax=Paenibacillus zeirhizosphaerae TaxID=2987519 RepID=A0ABT9FR06_9BACL|nr:aminoglycoside phosphotransferase family protein [Paenibacillus sp. P96]MDP4097104.1 aminoglycoside phosphotransferase family protein [Paenibacillus sp. P96]